MNVLQADHVLKRCIAAYLRRYRIEIRSLPEDQAGRMITLIGRDGRNPRLASLGVEFGDGGVQHRRQCRVTMERLAGDRTLQAGAMSVVGQRSIAAGCEA